ncbi:MAG: hypothetical protein ABIH03_15015, partial [Pseudomonadota bacterium]
VSGDTDQNARKQWTSKTAEEVRNSLELFALVIGETTPISAIDRDEIKRFRELLSDEVGPERSLLVLCPAFRGKGEYSNLTGKKIPKQVRSRCEWGHDDYSLRVENLPQKPPEPGQQALELE